MQPPYFIGINLPDELSNKIAKIQADLYNDKLLLKPLLPHITLIHPNPLTEISPLILVPKIRELTKDLDIKIKLNKFDMFNENVLYLSVGSTELEILYENIVDLLPEDTKAKYFISRKFVPHVTIAQAKPKTILTASLVNQYIQKLNLKLPYSFNINSLYKFNRQYSRFYSASRISDSSK